MYRFKIIVVCLIFIIIAGGMYFYKSIFDNTSIPATTTMGSNSDITSNNEFSYLPYYKEELLPRYSSYQLITNGLSTEDIVTYVNMQLDIGFYQGEPIGIAQPDALDVLVNKFYKLPDNWAPADLVQVNSTRDQYMERRAAEAFFRLQEACTQNGFTLTAYSAYRSTEYQNKIYNNMIDAHGIEETDKYVARPGQSEHATGLCVDVSIDGIYYEDIESSPYYTWFKEHLVEYGFILRYPQDKQHLTGYHYESWHIRYLGEELAKKVDNSGLTYDEYVARQ